MSSLSSETRPRAAGLRGPLITPRAVNNIEQHDETGLLAFIHNWTCRTDDLLRNPFHTAPRVGVGGVLCGTLCDMGHLGFFMGPDDHRHCGHSMDGE